MSTEPVLWSGTRYPDMTFGLSTAFAGDDLHVHLMDVEENMGPDLLDNLVAVCRDIREQYQPEAKLSDISWRLTSGIENSAFHVRERGGIVTRIDFEHGFRMMSGFSFSQYEEAFEDARGFDAALTSGHGYMNGSPVTLVPVTLPHKDGATQFFKCRDAAEDVVIADSAKLLTAWKAQTTSLAKTIKSLGASEESIRKTKWGSGYDAVLLSSPLEDSLCHIFINKAAFPEDMAKISFNPERDIEPIGFSNGRHRLFNAINAGAPFVPVEIPAEDGREAFKKAFEWDPEAPRRQTRPLSDIKVWGVSLMKRTLGQG